MYYFLKHKDDNVAILDMDNTTGMIISIDTIEKDLLPLCSQGKILNDAKPIRTWWGNRAVSKNQVNIRQLLEKYGIESTQKLLLDNLGLSLTDCYWVCPKGAKLSWKDVNLFQNVFNDDLAMQLEERNGGLSENALFADLVASFSPVASTGGELEKHWEKINGKIYLIKGNMPGNSYQQSLNEVFASNMHKKEGFSNFVSYSLTKLGRGITGCRSECFTSEGVELVPAWELLSRYKRPNNRSEHDFYVDTMETEGIDRRVAQNFMDYQSISDFLMTNLDRHINNFGILRDSNTLKTIGPAPIYDTRNSMLYINYLESSSLDLLSIKIKSLSNTEKSMMSHVKDFGVFDFSKLFARDEIISFYNQDETIRYNTERIANTFIYKKNIATLLASGLSFGQLESGIKALVEKDNRFWDTAFFNKTFEEKSMESISRQLISNMPNV